MIYHQICNGSNCFNPQGILCLNVCRICDLGSAGGANALRLLGWILPILNNERLRDIEYVFEDLPSADLNELASTVAAAKLPKNVLTR